VKTSTQAVRFVDSQVKVKKPVDFEEKVKALKRLDKP
jgi:hypothetical protein